MLIKDGLVFYKGQFEKKDIRVTGERFAAIEDGGRLEAEQGEEVYNAFGKRILPGLVDVHTHGRAGEDFSFVTEEALEKLCASYASCGVTSVLGTTMTNQPEAVERSLTCIGSFCTQRHPGARLLGVHMEGPFLGAAKKGAHDERYLRLPDREWFDDMRKKSQDRIRLVTVDPLLDGAAGFIKHCRSNGIFVSLGHTACNYEEAMTAARNGADHVTHLFNAMSPLHHREPGLIGAALDGGMYAELICDGIHLHPSIIRMMFAACPEQVLLISDSMQAAGLSDGEYELGGLKVFVKNGKAMQADGTIAGSTVSVYDAMVNAVRFGVPAEAAVNSAAYLPAKSVGLEGEAGSIETGRFADFLVVDKEWNLEQVYIGGCRSLFTRAS